jgi:LemA protein
MIIYIAGLILLFIFLVIMVVFILIYNRFQRLKNGAEAGLSQIKVALKKRLDMISQLVDVVKSYAQFEKKVLEHVTEMRSLVGKTNVAHDINKIHNESKSILESLFVVVENYPDLKTSENIKDLMSAITDVEDDIARQRYTYNNIVQEYNTRLSMIPSNVVARMFSYSELEYLKFDEDIKKRPDTEWST